MFEFRDGSVADDCLHARGLICRDGGETHEMSTCRVTEKRDALRIAFEFGGVSFDPPDRSLNIFEARGPTMLRRVSVIDREPGEVRCDEWTEPRRHVGAFARFV